MFVFSFFCLQTYLTFQPSNFETLRDDEEFKMDDLNPINPFLFDAKRSPKKRSLSKTDSTRSDSFSADNHPTSTEQPLVETVIPEGDFLTEEYMHMMTNESELCELQPFEQKLGGQGNDFPTDFLESIFDE